eukprot:12007947-Alexandrium_andersonii.AAC.1
MVRWLRLHAATTSRRCGGLNTTRASLQAERAGSSKCCPCQAEKVLDAEYRSNRVASRTDRTE